MTKKVKRVISFFVTLVLALTMMLGTGMTVLAAETTYKITVANEATGISIVGNTYKAYKLFDAKFTADGKSATYTITNKFKDFEYKDEDDTYKADDLPGYLSKLDSDSEQMNAFAEAVSNYIDDNKIEKDAEAKATAESVDIVVPSGGYYLIGGTAASKADYENIDNTGTKDKTEIIASCALTSVQTEATVKVKADAPSIIKKIDGAKDTDDGTKELVDFNNAAIGDFVPYVIKSAVPDMTGYEKYYFIVNDTMSAGLTYDDAKADLEVMVGSEKLSKTTNTKDTGKTYTLVKTDNDDGTTSLEIAFNNFLQYEKGAEVKITYNAVLNEKAVIENPGNPNIVDLTYSRNPNVKGAGDNKPTDEEKDKVTGTTPKDKVITYTTKFEINKVDKSTQGVLAGAKFTLEGTKLNTVLVSKETFTEATDGTYYKLKNGTYTTEEPSDTTKDQFDDTEKKYKVEVSTETVTKGEEKTIVTATVDDQGKLVFTGLAAGDYTITEIEAPSGYNKLDKSITLNIAFTAPTEITGDASWTYNKSSDNVLKIENESGSLLPSTGGIGTTIFYIIGAILFVGAGITLVTRRRMNNISND